MMGKSFLCFVFVLVFCRSLESTSIGVRFRLTSSGLRYACDVGISTLVKSLQTAKIRDVTGSSGTPIGSINYEICNIEVTSASIQGSHLKSLPTVGLQLEASGLSVALKGHWHYKKQHWPHISDSGNVDLSVQGVSFSFTVKVGADPNTGRPTMSPAECSSSIDDVIVKFHGGASWLYNLFRNSIANSVHKSLQEMICKSAAKYINDDVSSSLATFQVRKRLDKWAFLNYELTQQPFFTTQYFDVFLKGAVESVTLPSDPGFPPQPLPKSPEAFKMANIWISDFLANTATEVYTKAGVLSGKITPDMVPEKSPFKLDTSTFEVLIPKLFALYPNRPMMIKIHTHHPPKMNTEPSGMNLTGLVHVGLAVILENSTIVDVILFELYLETVVSLRVEFGLIVGESKLTSIDVVKVTSKIGNIKSNIPHLKTLFEFFGKQVLVREMNKFLAKGVPLPSINNMDFVNTEIVTEKHFVKLSTDLRYVPDLKRVRQSQKDKEMAKQVFDFTEEEDQLSQIKSAGFININE